MESVNRIINSPQGDAKIVGINMKKKQVTRELRKLTHLVKRVTLKKLM